MALEMECFRSGHHVLVSHLWRCGQQKCWQFPFKYFRGWSCECPSQTSKDGELIWLRPHLLLSSPSPCSHSCAQPTTDVASVPRQSWVSGLPWWPALAPEASDGLALMAYEDYLRGPSSEPPAALDTFTLPVHAVSDPHCSPRSLPALCQPLFSPILVSSNKVLAF